MEAAAATAVIVDDDASISVAPPQTPLPMVVDRPYLVSVVDAPTASIVLLGQIEDPTDPGGT